MKGRRRAWTAAQELDTETAGPAPPGPATITKTDYRPKEADNDHATRPSRRSA